MPPTVGVYRHCGHRHLGKVGVGVAGDQPIVQVAVLGHTDFHAGMPSVAIDRDQ